MRNPSFLVLSRHNIFYFRWPLPQCRHPGNRRSWLKVSLRTRHPSEALRLSRYFGYLAETLIAQKAMSAMRYDEIRAVLKRHFSVLLEQRRTMVAEHGPSTRDEIAMTELGRSIAKQAIARDEALSLVGDDGPTLRQLINIYGLPIEQGSRAYELLGQELRKAYLGYCEGLLALEQDLDAIDLRSPTSAADTDLVSNSSPAATLQHVVTEYLGEQRKSGRWTFRTAEEKQKNIDLLLEVLGPTRDIRTITAREAREVKSKLNKLPKNRNKHAATAKLSVDEAIKVENVARLTVTSIDKYLQAYNGLFRWAKRNQYIDTNVFDGLSMPQNRARIANEREPFTTDQSKAIIHELFANTTKVVRNDYHVWGPLIAFYTGARLNEISQILIKDIREVDGILCFDLNDDDEGKKLKNAASRRIVPVHPKLKHYGFVEFVWRLGSSPGDKLFTGLTYCSRNGWGRNLGRWFNENLLVKMKLKSPSLVFHSIRHSVVTSLLQADVEEPVVKAVVGHAQAGVTQQSYFRKGYKLPQLLAALEKLPY